MGLPNGINSFLKDGTGTDQEAFRWIRDGARLEDSPSCRATHHFHDPLKPFDQAAVSDMGFTATGLLLQLYCQRELSSLLPGVTGFRSNVIWATRFTDPTTKGDATGNPFDWDTARAAYAAALTQPTAAGRDAGLARTFTALGHVLHLVQDVAVPAHVRNDFTAHLEVCASLSALLSGQVRINDACGNSFERFVRRRPDLVDGAATATVPVLPGTLLPRFWDTNQYTGANPSADLDQGLAEYTNANFLSGTSLFENADPLHRYPHPAKASTNLATYLADPQAFPVGSCRAPDGGLDTVRYLAKTGGGEQIAKFLKVGFLTFYEPGAGLALPPSVAFQFDDCVHTAYAEKLLPRAAGYSAGLLDYFFRGRLRVVQLAAATTSVDPGLLLPQANDTGRDIDTVTVWLLNASRLGDQAERIVPDPETGQAGTLSLIARYQVGNEERSASFVLKDPAAFTSIPHMDDGANPLPLAFVLAPGHNPVPTQEASKLEYTLVFQGQLGEEKGAVIGRVLEGPILIGADPSTGLLGATVTVTADSLDDRTVARFSRLFTGTPSEQARQGNTIIARVPDTASLGKPGAGGLRLLTTLATGEVLFSNPVPFTPLAEGRVRNDTAVALEVTIIAVGPIVQDAPAPLPPPVTVTVPPKSAVADVILSTGFRYQTSPPAQGQPATGFPVEYVIADVDDFVIGF